MLRYLTCAALTLSAITGCATVTVEQRRGAGSYTLMHRYGDNPDYAAMVERLSARAEKVCAGPYRKVKSYDTSIGPKGWRLVWEIRCEKVPQVFKRLPGPQPAGGR